MLCLKKGEGAYSPLFILSGFLPECDVELSRKDVREEVEEAGVPEENHRPWASNW
jgi:hypothetical protein